MADMQKDTPNTGGNQTSDLSEQGHGAAGSAEFSELALGLLQDFRGDARSTMEERVENGEHILDVWLSGRRNLCHPHFSAVSEICGQRFNSARDAEHEPEA